MESQGETQALENRVEAVRSVKQICRAVRKEISKPGQRVAGVKISLDLAARKIEGGKNTVIEYCRSAASQSKECEIIVAVWDNLMKKERHAITLDQLCDYAGVPRKAVLGQIAAEACEHGNDVANLILGNAVPRVAEASVRSAQIKGPKGFRDREMIMTSRGLMPLPKGAQILIQNNQVNRQPSDTDMPTFEEDIMDVASEQQFLPPVEGE